MEDQVTKKVEPIVVSWIQSKYQGDESDTVDHYLSLATSLGKVDLIVFPELFSRNYFPLVEDDACFGYARQQDDIWFGQFSHLAREKQAVVVVPYFEKEGDIYFNSAKIFEKNGTVAGHYRKMHIPYDPGFYEKYYFADGDTGFEPIVTSIGTIGLLICWDQWFPEAARIMSLKGADILIYPTAIGWDDTESDSVNDEQLDAWKTTMRAHAICNGIHTIAVNRIGVEGKIEFWGNSFICQPSGAILNVPNKNEEIYSTTIDLSDSKKYREVWPFFRDRRVNDYSELLKKGVTKVQTGLPSPKKWK